MDCVAERFKRFVSALGSVLMNGQPHLMKISNLMAALAALSIGSFPIVSLAAAHDQPGATKVTVTYVDWQKFSDIKDRFDWTEPGELAILKSLEASLQRDAKFYVPDGDHLTMIVTDIRLAGEYEPERGPQWDEVRIVRDIYPPRFVFTYSVTDPSGKVVKSGKENLSDIDFQNHISIDGSDPLHYEKDMLSSWMQRKMHGL